MTQLDLQQRLEQAKEELTHQISVNRILCENANRREREFDALQQQVNALAAENAALLEFIRESCYTLEDDWETSGFVTDAYQSLPDMPATDAIKRQWMAEGVEKFAGFCGEENSVFVEAKAHYRSLPDAAAEFAAQLRVSIDSD